MVLMGESFQQVLEGNRIDITLREEFFCSENSPIITNNNMQLLGIYLYEETPKAVRKTLQPDWYPFGNYRKPAKSKPVDVGDYKNTVAYQIYQKAGLPEISVNCIVGMNGAGKSTLLDILYRMINNVAVRLLGPKASVKRGRHLTYARGVYADFYFLCENNQYRVSCRDNQTSLYKKDNKTGFFQIDSIRNHEDAKSVLSNLFYTISTNYSLYAFNQSEYMAEEDEGIVENDASINGEWLSGLFHKNDGFFTPLVITPFRETGNIDVEKENRLASQRIMALALLQQAQGVSFIDRYEPRKIHYELDKEYKLRTEKNYQLNISEQYNGLDIRHIIRHFEALWEGYFESINNGVIEDRFRERYDQALFYLAYKTVKICFTYEDYSKTFGLETLLKHCDDLGSFTSYCNKELPKKAKAVFKKVLAEMTDPQGDRNHITLKLSVCEKFIERLLTKNPEWEEKGDAFVSELIDGKNIQTYNDAVLLLPPAFYRCNMTFGVKGNSVTVPDSSWGGITKKEEFSLSKMSSGERQMLYSLSYVLYHIKNIQSIKEDENRVAYHNICLIFDEAELYFHPDYQRKFLGMLLESLSWCNINPSKIHSIQILVVTHSPFVLTDMLVQNSLYLKDGERVKVERETFGANYYEMLNKSFFFKERAIGDISARVISDWIKAKNNKESISDEQLKLVGDAFLKNYLKNYVQD